MNIAVTINYNKIIEEGKSKRCISTKIFDSKTSIIKIYNWLKSLDNNINFEDAIFSIVE